PPLLKIAFRRSDEGRLYVKRDKNRVESRNRYWMELAFLGVVFAAFACFRRDGPSKNRRSSAEIRTAASLGTDCQPQILEQAKHLARRGRRRLPVARLLFRA